MSATPSRRVVVFSGGSAANSLVDVFNDLIEKNNWSLSYVIPISDNGGSSSELIRVFGGPGIGDVRSIASCSCLLRLQHRLISSMFEDLNTCALYRCSMSSLIACFNLSLFHIAGYYVSR